VGRHPRGLLAIPIPENSPPARSRELSDSAGLRRGFVFSRGGVRRCNDGACGSKGLLVLGSILGGPVLAGRVGVCRDVYGIGHILQNIQFTPLCEPSYRETTPTSSPSPPTPPKSPSLHTPPTPSQRSPAPPLSLSLYSPRLQPANLAQGHAIHPGGRHQWSQ
jgi:hypothetical protein